jgi:hypothetical protein
LFLFYCPQNEMELNENNHKQKIADTSYLVVYCYLKSYILLSTK